MKHHRGLVLTRVEDQTEAGVAQLGSARPLELEVPSSILGDSNVCFDFLLICVHVAWASYTPKMEHWQRKRIKCTPRATSLSVNYCHMLPSLIKVALPFTCTFFTPECFVQLKSLGWQDCKMAMKMTERQAKCNFQKLISLTCTDQVKILKSINQ